MTDERQRELAYRFDLFIAADWSERFDTIVAEHAEMPKKGRILEINCGTGSRALAVADGLEDVEVVGTDPSGERIALARAKAQVANAERVTFVETDAHGLAFEDASFDAVVLDASLVPPPDLGVLATEALRVARREAPVVVKTILRGSFDEFYSVFWEALHEVEIADDLWPRLEPIVTRLLTFEDAKAALKRVGLRNASPHRTKEEWRFETGEAFLDSPLVTDLFLADWLAIVPADRLEEVRGAIARTIDEARDGAYFYVSVKTLVVVGMR
jgi:ubiquinone/menaquinone biosynthesis C-methylase UbiE